MTIKHVFLVYLLFFIHSNNTGSIKAHVKHLKRAYPEHIIAIHAHSITWADGTIMPSYIAGANGDVDIEVQEVSILHKALLSLYNTLVLQADGADILGWAATSISFALLIDGSTHVLTGVSFDKIPDKPYQAAGQKITWKLMATNIVQI